MGPGIAKKGDDKYGVTQFKENCPSLAKEEDKEKWRKNDNKCKSLIVKCIAVSYLEYVMGKNTSKEIWNSLLKTFERKRVASLLYLKKRLLTIKCSGKINLESHFKYEAIVSVHFRQRIQSLRCDNGDKYTSHNFKNLCAQKGIVENHTAPYTPKQNGLAERTNRTIIEKTRLLLFQSGLLTKTYTLQENNFKDEVLTIEYNCLFREPRVVIPVSLRKLILEELHTALTNTTKMKELARRYSWWPTINLEIEDYVKSYQQCAENQKNQTKFAMSWKEEPIPWYRLYVDHAGLFMGSYFLILIDTYSKGLEVKIVPSLSSKTTIENLQKIFSRFGLSIIMVRNNGKACTSN
ncbi:Integrase, catalytic core,Ribonuclease H-like domain [Cinara cedri]|uniref:RNA-directed DNA polymerase n=1 Tax=Cinara cedri TaxID=506608 RepID=A0A5E4MB74_9HEMI|nr:Integrase, catalytic core,Ribonuclease H-like domain [Cinara cedri]